MATSACFPLTGSRACGLFGDLKVQPYRNVFTNVQELDLYIEDSLPKSALYRTYFQSNFTCPRWDGTGLRYPVSFLCGLIVDISTTQFNCNPGVNVVNICRSTGAAAINSYQNIFNNQAYCTPGANRPLPERYLTFAGKITADDPASGSCKLGTDEEIRMCGEFQLDLTF